MKRESEAMVAYFSAEELEHESKRPIRTTEHQNKRCFLPADTVWKFVAGS